MRGSVRILFRLIFLAIFSRRFYWFRAVEGVGDLFIIIVFSLG